MSIRPAVIVMVKAPRVGQVKTRLTPALTEVESAAIAICFARDTVEKAVRIGHPVLVAFTPADSRQALASLLPEAAGWLLQRGSDLGERMTCALTEAAASGYGPCLVVGTDSPTLPVETLKQAIQALTAGSADVALGPTDDGGYYLLGVRVAPPHDLLNGVAWSSPRTFAQTAGRIDTLRLRLAMLPAWYDVDTIEDLRRLRREMSENPDARVAAPHTWRWLQARGDLPGDP